MKRPKRDERREKRIDMEVIVDAYDEEERAMGWYYYLDEAISFPFKAKCIQKRHRSPLKEDDMVEVLAMAPEDTCLREMYVNVNRGGEIFYAPLRQLEGIAVNEETQEAVEDWHYWIGRGYGF